jgi:hypothetical protein
VGSTVWTGSDANGSKATNGSCKSWSHASVDPAFTGTIGTVGEGSEWLSSGSVTCDQAHRLYCITQ